MGTLVAVRSLGALLSPTLGGLLYPVHHGGWTLPFLVGACVFMVLYASLFLVSACGEAMTPIVSSATTVQALRVKQVWAVLIANPFLCGFVAFLLEPLYEPLLSEPPYNCSTQVIGLVASSIPTMQVPALVFVGAWLHNLTGPSVQQALGAVLIVCGTLLLGPSPIFGSWLSPSLHLFVGGLFCIGLGSGIAIPTNPLFVLKILHREAGLTKEELGGVIASTTATFYFAGALIAPMVGSLMYEIVGFQWLTTGWAFTFIAIFLPCACVLAKYN
jgi:MFS family permease